MARLARFVLLFVLVSLLLPADAFAVYASSCTITNRSVSGRNLIVVSITETGAAPTDEVTCVGLPVKGTIVSYEATLTAGTGATIDPVIGRAAAFVVSTQDHVASNGAAAAHIHNQDPVKYYSSTGKLYIRSVPSDPAADHAITTELLIAEGWEP